MALIVDKKTGRTTTVETRGRPKKGETAAQAQSRRIAAAVKKSKKK